MSFADFRFFGNCIGRHKWWDRHWHMTCSETALGKTLDSRFSLCSSPSSSSWCISFTHTFPLGYRLTFSSPTQPLLSVCWRIVHSTRWCTSRSIRKLDVTPSRCCAVCPTVFLTLMCKVYNAHTFLWLRNQIACSTQQLRCKQFVLFLLLHWLT